MIGVSGETLRSDNRESDGRVQVRRHSIGYASAWAAFEDGNYGYAATHAGDDRLLRGASLVMLGHYEGGAPLLDGLDDPRASYYRSIILWGTGADRDARKEVARCLRGPVNRPDCARRAERLQRLITRGRLRVLVQGKNEAPPSSFSIIEAMRRTSCDVVSIGYDSRDDVQLEPYESLDEVLRRLPAGWAPHWYHCYQIESHLMPIGLESAPFPVLGYVSDYDTRVHTCFHRAQAVDAIVVTGEVDHHEIRRGFRLPCVVFPKAVGVWAEAFERADPSRKDVDLFCSGTTMSFYQQDKGRLVYRLMQLSDRCRVRIHRGYLSPEQYIAATARSKAVFSFVRRQPVWSSRAVDALAGGAAVLYQAGGGLELFFSETEGAVPYREDNLETVAERVVREWEHTYAQAAMRGRARVLKEFDLVVCMERYLKRLAILAAETRRLPGSRSALRRESTLRYPPFARGGVVVASDQRRRVWKVGFEKTIHRLTGVPQARRSPNEFNVLAFAHFLLGFHQAHADGRSGEQTIGREAHDHLHQAWRTFEGGHARYPHDVILLFNWGRVACVLKQHRAAHDIFMKILSSRALTLDPLEDLFGDDFADRHFPFRAYVDGVMRYLVTREQADVCWLLRLVVSSVWRYRGLLEYERGNQAAAGRSFREGLRRFSAHPAYHDTYGDTPLLHGGGTPRWTEKVVSHLKIAWSLAPYNQGILHRLILGLERIGCHDEARLYRERYDRIIESLGGASIVRVPRSSPPCGDAAVR